MHSTQPRMQMFTKRSGRVWTISLTDGLGRPKRCSPRCGAVIVYRAELTVHTRRARSLLAMRVELQEHQHHEQTILARSDLSYSSVVGDQLAVRRFAEDLESAARVCAN